MYFRRNLYDYKRMLSLSLTFLAHAQHALNDFKHMLSTLFNYFKSMLSMRIEFKITNIRPNRENFFLVP
jgi:hypothetical protein